MKFLSLATFSFLSPALALAASTYTAQALATDWEKSDAMYEVPVPENLKDVAVFEISDVRSRIKNGTAEIKYTLPLALTGVPTRIRLKETSSGLFSGPLGSAKCAEGTCEVHYKNLQLNEPAVREHLVRNGSSGLDLERRLQVFERFSGDPVGIVRRKK